MNETSSKPTREERLAAKLRENLKRRKVQARAITADDAVVDAFDDAFNDSGETSPSQDALSKGAADR